MFDAVRRPARRVAADDAALQGATLRIRTFVDLNDEEAVQSFCSNSRMVRD